VPEYGLAALDATLPVEVQQRALRDLVRPHLAGIVTAPRAADLDGAEERRA